MQTVSLLIFFEKPVFILDGHNQLPGHLKQRFIGRDEELKTDGVKLLKQVKKMLREQEFTVYTTDTYKVSIF